MFVVATKLFIILANIKRMRSNYFGISRDKFEVSEEIPSGYIQ